MRSFFARFSASIRRFMYGRYGYDKLSTHLLWASLGAYIISLFVLRIPFSLLYAVLLLLSLLRVFSRNRAKRYQELTKYNRILSRVKGFFKLQKNKLKDRKTFLYFKCSCGAVLRVPRKKGEIIVHCPKCKRSIEKKT